MMSRRNTKGPTHCLPSLKSIEHWSSLTAQRWAEALIGVADRFRAIVAVGSSVRDVSYSADLDVILIYDGEEPDFPKPPIEVDARLYPSDDVESLVRHGQNELLASAIRFGKVVHEQECYWTDLVERWRERLPLPSASSARERAKRARILARELRNVGDKDAANEQDLTMLTHLARSHLIESGVYPASRPELPGQLRAIGKERLATRLSEALEKRERILR